MIINSENLTILTDTYSAAFSEGFGQAPADHEGLAMEPPAGSRRQEYGWLGAVASLRRWVGERVLRGIESHGYSLESVPYESSVEVSAYDIKDDQYGVYKPLFQEMGRAAAAHPCELIYAAMRSGHESLCYDGQYFFDGDHPSVTADGAETTVGNYQAGSEEPWFLVDTTRAIKPFLFQRRDDYDFTHMDEMTDEAVFMRKVFRYGVDARVAAGYGLWQLAYASRDTLDATNFEAARTAMMGYRNPAGRPMGIMPNLLVVGPANEHEALELLNAERLANGATNVWRGKAELRVTPWLAS